MTTKATRKARETFPTINSLLTASLQIESMKQFIKQMERADYCDSEGRELTKHPAFKKMRDYLREK